MDISYHRYGLKFRGRTSGNARSGRHVLEGFLIRVDGGYGCVQPWPELGDETLEEQWQAIKSGGRTGLLDRALECAAVDAAARREGRSLFEGLAVPQSHATVAGEADFLALRAEGFTVVKLKGEPDWQEVLRRMRRAVAAGLRVRVDFNSVLDAAEFVRFTKAADDVRGWVDFVEDPVPYTAAGWEWLRAETGWRLGLDWVRGGVPAEGGFDVRVLKPAADAPGTGPDLDAPVVVTSYMDHPLGQSFAAWEAARYAGAGELAGLLTHRLFEPDAFTERLAARGPDWTGPGGTGLGFDDLLEKLPWVSLTDPGGVWTGMAGRVLHNPRDPLPEGGPVLPAGHVGFSTSGSTGVPSVVVHTGATLLASAGAVNSWLGVRAEDVWLRVLPEFHVGGYQIGVRAALAGSRVVTDGSKWDAARFVETCHAEGVTLSSLVPAQVVDLVRWGRPAPPTLRAVVVGGGSLERTSWLMARTLGWPVRRSYGATEAGSQVATERGGGAEPNVGPAVAPAVVCSAQSSTADVPPKPTGAWLSPSIAMAGMIEKAIPPNPPPPDDPMEILPHWEARLVPEAGGPDAESGVGILELRGPALAAGRFLWKDSRWMAQDLTDAEGWWRTTDRVILSGRELRFAGRADRVVKVLGELVHLETVEQSLAESGLPAGTFCVIAVPEQRRGMELILVVETEGGGPDRPDPLPAGPQVPRQMSAAPAGLPGGSGAGSGLPAWQKALDAYTRRAIPFARISRVVQVDRLPRSPLGKVRWAVVAEWVPPREAPG